MANRDFDVCDHTVTPWIQPEWFYDTRYDAWARQRQLARLPSRFDLWAHTTLLTLAGAAIAITRGMASRSRFAILGFGALTAAAAALGALTMRGKGRPDGRWFQSLRKSRLQPPNWVFGPVWTLLYATIAYSGWRVWQADDSPKRSRALALWGVQVGLNALWTPLFFGARKPALALADLLALDAAALGFAATARHVEPAAAKAFVPYLGWIAFATALNAAIVTKSSE